MNIGLASNNFYKRFNTSHVLLYVGRGISDAELEVIAPLPWSAVITSRPDEGFFESFLSGNRTVFVKYAKAYDEEQIHSRIELNRANTPILQLFGTPDNQDSDYTDQEYMECAREMLRILPNLMDYVNPLVMVGLDSEIDWDLLNARFFKRFCANTSEGSVSVWGISSEIRALHAKTFEYFEQVKANIYEYPLIDAIRSREVETLQDLSDNNLVGNSASDDMYYQAGIPISISQSDLLYFKNVGILLTERALNQIHPLGRILQQKWFSNFLESSATLGPQWYGYLKQSTFYVKRSFEDALFLLVKQQLRGQGITGQQEESCPIILSGPPCSSKSITLGALAYRIYNEHTNPVIFISNEYFQSFGGDQEYLDSALRLLEDKAPVENRILVIWDCSTYRSGIDRAKRLLDFLVNRGRRLVLVCSSYELGSSYNVGGTYYSYSKEKDVFEPDKNAQNHQVLRRRDHYIIFAGRSMDEREQAKFWDICREYSGIPSAIISRQRERLKHENKTEIFDFYYMLITLLRNALEEGLRTEQNKVYSHVRNELDFVLKNIQANVKSEKKLNPIYQAFVDAGIDISQFDSNDNASSAEDDEAIEQNLKDLDTCIALFSRFKLDVSYGLAYTILANGNYGNARGIVTQNLFTIATTGIPWLYYGENSNGDFIFRFRNALEADIFLNSHGITGERQVDLVCQIIDIYGKDYVKNNCKDPRFTDNLQALLRMMGPNSTYTPFRFEREYEHKCILKKLDVLTDKVYQIIDSKGYNVPDEDAGFSIIVVTFTREYYSSILEDQFSRIDGNDVGKMDSSNVISSYELRIKKLCDAISLAENKLTALEDRLLDKNNMTNSDLDHLTTQRNSLIVEKAQCSLRLQRLYDPYKERCNKLGRSPVVQIETASVGYSTLQQQLLKVIEKDPTNGYAYNALFSAFEQMYEGEGTSNDDKLQYLSIIMQFVDTCQMMDQEIRGRGSNERDELSEHIAKIINYSNRISITLADVNDFRHGNRPDEAKENTFYQLYLQMLEDARPAAITFLCQKELRLPKAGTTLNTDQQLRCSNVYFFMRDKDNFRCISRDAYALDRFIRVVWMHYTNHPLFYRPERQITKLNAAQWEELRSLCEMYHSLASETSKQPILTLLFALATLQASGRSPQGFSDAKHILGTISELNFRHPRMLTPFLICDEKGLPCHFAGTVTNIDGKNNNGFLKIVGGPASVRFRLRNLGNRTTMPAINEGLRDLELGIGYTGFSAYKREGRL